MSTTHELAAGVDVREAVLTQEPDQLQQYATFEDLAPHFGGVLQALERAGDISRWLHPTWEQSNRAIVERLSPQPHVAFLRIPEIAWMMFVHAGGDWYDHQIDLLRRSHDAATLHRLLTENSVGAPPLISRAPITSHNSVHHLYHLTRYQQATGADLTALPVVVEWGGGYGNLVKIHRRLSGPQVTNIVVDTPLFTAVQWLYLSSVLGPSRVHLVRSVQDGLVEGAVNLVALPFVESLDVQADLFVSTWALSESSLAAQRWVGEDRGWFGARRLLLAVQHEDEVWNTAATVTRSACAAGAAVHAMPYPAGNDYVFA